MKKLTTILLGFLFVSGSLFGADQTETTVTRSQFWGRLAFKGQLMDNGLGVFAMVGSRNNLSIDITNKVGGTETDVENLETQGSWLNEVWVGPSYTTKLAPKFKYSGILAYRPQIWFMGDPKKFNSDAPAAKQDVLWGEQHMRHTIDFHNNFIYNLGFMKLKYRLILWDTLPYTDGLTKDADDATKDYEWSNQLISRNKFEIIVPVHKMLDLVVAEEIFLNLTPDENEGDVTFWKNAIWAGVDVKPIKGLNVMLRYIHFLTYAEGDENTDYIGNQKKTVIDHYAFVQVNYSMNLAGNKKAQEMMDKAKESDEYKDAKDEVEAKKGEAEDKIEEEKEGL